MNSDFRDLLRTLHEEKVRFLVAGGYAVIHHTQPRYTKDIDIWVEPSTENARLLMRALAKFGISLIGLTEADFAEPKTQLSVGVAPSEIDLLTSIPGLDFHAAWENKVISNEHGLPIPYLGKSDLITAKITAGRNQDLADLDELRRADPQGDS